MFNEIYEKCKNLELENKELKSEIKKLKNNENVYFHENIILRDRVFDKEVIHSILNDEIKLLNEHVELIKSQDVNLEIKSLKEKLSAAKSCSSAYEKESKTFLEEKRNLEVKNKELEDTKKSLEDRITELLSEINIIESAYQHQKRAFDRASCYGWELQDKLNKIPQWIQKIFIR